MSEIRSNLSQYYASKALFETVLGRDAFVRVKDFGSLAAWRENYSKLLGAIRVSVEATVKICDEEWKSQVALLLTHGLDGVKTAKSIDEIHASAAATLGELAFLQLGFVPLGHRTCKNIPLVPKNWDMSPVRTVQYVQSPTQRETQRSLRDKKKATS
ncbi:hypothetical protein KUF54_11590 [Comamonas sp. Y33R10-2]|uniref:hypothetical protein n=1 Tax=Comamonas sp. Y33R10-2 TaxID=2853257 RepID=UPI001C5C950C|nr:hypothetical protein [Comamonas sp. Y33R10-2]QXZ08704.1 hypothetical protein KUF54_11590 [Comamonas sp. Y33R10-2]